MCQGLKTPTTEIEPVTVQTFISGNFDHGLLLNKVKLTNYLDMK